MSGSSSSRHASATRLRSPPELTCGDGDGDSDGGCDSGDEKEIGGQTSEDSDIDLGFESGHQNQIKESNSKPTKDYPRPRYDTQ